MVKLKNKYITDPVFSNLNLDDKGRVGFDLTFNVDPTFVNYKDMLLRMSAMPVVPTMLDQDTEVNQNPPVDDTNPNPDQTN